MAQKAREENEQLKQRVALLEEVLRSWKPRSQSRRRPARSAAEKGSNEAIDWSRWSRDRERGESDVRKR
jgi:BMFP domain-containing protein YqiC